MGYWKTKVLPKIKKVFEKNATTTKKAAAAEACKSFDESKDEINKEFEEKKGELQPKVLEIYEACSVEIKGLVKEPKEAGIKKSSAAVHKLLEELAKIEFPGSKAVTEASSKYGAGLVSGPVIFVFEKVSTFVPVEAAPVVGEEEKKSEEEVITKVEKEIVIEEDKIQEEEEKPSTATTSTATTTTTAPAAEEPPKAEVEVADPPPPKQP
ncbi:plasma membrane-associated cation-binding protein 1-like [Humulus lupulus]|uniref:plasma membrane-associated cation-binding protein 1-like n=1 Tax=Humulus lupulus TaxID=3486 RepID=UPI002B40E2DA|nr:plasma membrane-associated cation-binding protein 1-like [Humulus lupulus]